MNATSRLALWLVLAADAMFFVGLLSASRVMPQQVIGRQWRMDLAAVALLTIGRFLRGRLLPIFSCLGAVALLTLNLQRPVDIQWLLHAGLLVHALLLIGATFALLDEINLLWEFIIAMGWMMIASMI